MRDEKQDRVRSETADLQALVTRIHRDLRRERAQRRWQEGKAERRISWLAALVVITPLVIAAIVLTLAARG